MKTLIIYLTFSLVAGNLCAQKIIELPEARVEFSALNSDDYNGNSFTYAIKDTSKGEFEMDPVAFMKKHFDIDEFKSQMEKRNFDSYEVSFRSRKGVLKVEFDDEGNIVNTTQKFKDILLPANLRHNLYRDYKGWAMVGNLHQASGRNDKIDREVYRIKLEKGNRKKTIRIRPDSLNGSEVASN